MHLEQPDATAIRDCIGLDVRYMIRALFPDLSSSQCSSLQDRYWQHFYAKHFPAVKLYDGVVEVLRALKEKGLQLAVATGKSRAGLDSDMLEMGVSDLFVQTITADEAPSKPNPTMLFDLLAQLDVPVERAIMIGDSVYDIEMAHSANMDAIGVSYGVHASEVLQGLSPKKVVDNLQELLALLV